MKKLSCYIAGPLFSEQDRKMLENIARHLEVRNVNVFLPHRDIGDLSISKKAIKSKKIRDDIFEGDLRYIRNSDFVLALLDGSDIDSGTAAELGIAFSLKKSIFGLKTDYKRRGFVINNMIWGILEKGERLYIKKDEILKEIDRIYNLKQV